MGDVLRGEGEGTPGEPEQREPRYRDLGCIKDGGNLKEEALKEGGCWTASYSPLHRASLQGRV